MVNRAQVLMNSTGVYLFTHDNGDKLESIVKKVLQTKQGWEDPEYLTRMVFTQMTKGSKNIKDGFGIGTRYHISCLQHPLIIVDSVLKLVFVGEEMQTFEEFIK